MKVTNPGRSLVRFVLEKALPPSKEKGALLYAREGEIRVRVRGRETEGDWKSRENGGFFVSFLT